MRITIAQHLRPFSHVPGTCCLIPLCQLEAKIFPTKLIFYHAHFPEKVIDELTFSFQAPWKEFTILQDLEKNRIEVFGHTALGFVRYFLFVKENSLRILFEKTPGHTCLLAHQEIKVASKDEIAIPIELGSVSKKVSKERLFLGIDKSLDWDLIQRRLDLREIFPIWFRLSECIPKTPLHQSLENLQLLKDCMDAIQSKDKKELSRLFLNLLQGGFEGILCPRSIDVHYWGFPSQANKTDQSILTVLHESGSLIRSLFFQEHENTYELLGCLLPEFHSGRLMHIEMLNGDLIHMEWSKKLLQKVIITARSTGAIALKLQSALKTYRLRRSLHDRGKKMMKDEPLFLESGKTFYLDRFEK